MNSNKQTTNIYTFKDEKLPKFETQYEAWYRDDCVPIIIDNGGCPGPGFSKELKYKLMRTCSASKEYSPTLKGSHHCRAGWATHNKPDLIFKNVTAKQRNRKEKDAEIQLGNDVSNFEMVRLLMRSQFDRNLVTQYDLQELLFDYMFGHLGINTDRVGHPIVLTEPVANPNYCRQKMSELLFECYHVPKVAYGVDSLFSLYNNHPNPESANGIVIGCGYQTTHILPVLQGRINLGQCRRINMGGAHIDGFMQRLLQLKYPGHLNAVTLSRAEELVRDHTHIAVDYLSDLDEWRSDEYYTENVHKIQLPFANAPGSLISAQQQKERREQQIRRLKEVNAKKRQERLAEEEEELKQLMQIQELLDDDDDDDFNGRQNVLFGKGLILYGKTEEEEELKRLMQIQELLDDDDDDDFNNALQEKGYENEEELQAHINKLTISIQRLRAVLQGTEPPVEENEPKKQAVYDLLDVPDDQLSPEQIVKKKRQYILKKAREGRVKAQALQREKRQKELEAEKVLERKRIVDFPGWLAEVRQKRQKLLDTRNSRKQKKSDMAKRRTFAAQQRMKIISQLAKNTKKDDTFGIDDKDWDVYKEINPNNSDSDSEAEEIKLEELETMLKEHDPEFQKELDEAAGEFDIAEYYRLHVAVERIRVPELLFQPSMIGIEQAGIAETLNFVFNKFSPEDQDKLAQYVFVSGSNGNFPWFKQRLERELLQMRPFQSTFSVHVADNPTLDAWYGAKKWVSSPVVQDYWVTRADYEEKGAEYLKEFTASNRYRPTPVLIQ